MLTAAIGFSAVNLDTSGVSRANSANFLSDLHMTTDGDVTQVTLGFPRGD